MEPDPGRLHDLSHNECCACYVLEGQNLNCLYMLVQPWLFGMQQPLACMPTYCTVSGTYPAPLAQALPCLST